MLHRNVRGRDTNPGSTTKFGLLIIRIIIKKTFLSDVAFKANMHKIRSMASVCLPLRPFVCVLDGV